MTRPTRRERPGTSRALSKGNRGAASQSQRTETPPDLLATALDALAHGLNVLPPKQDGTKAPDARRWTERQAFLASEDEVRAWYEGTARTGLGLVCGAVSGGLELFEFEGRATTAGSLSEASQQMANTSEEAGRAVGEIAHAVGEVASGAERR